jgi:hypothetical protein
LFCLGTIHSIYLPEQLNFWLLPLEEGSDPLKITANAVTVIEVKILSKRAEFANLYQQESTNNYK